jgi:SPP1 gp7 family putative phage head morphogenesis protein
MNSKDYWAKREKEALKHYIQDEAEYDKQINQIYSDMLDSVQTQINGFYGKYAAKEEITLAEAKKRVSKLDIAAYERKAKRYVEDKDFSDKANEEMRLYNATMKINRLEMLKANIGLELIAGTDELEKFMAEILQGRTEEELKRQAGILGKTILNNAKAAHAIPNASFHNATFSDRIWMYQDLLKADLSKLLQTGLIQGKNPRVLARELKKSFDTSTYNAERLMRTELARVQTEAQKLSFERNGFEEYIFIVNSGCCDICKEIDGKHFKVKDMMPGENAAPMHPHCRCSVAAYSDDKEYKEWLNFLANGGTTEEYNKLKEKGVPITSKKKPKTQTKSVKSIEDVKDFDGLDSYLQKEYNIGVEDSVKQLDFTTVKSALTGCESVIKRFPGVAKTLKQLVTSKLGVMSCGGEKISFNPFHFQDDKKLIESCAKQSSSRWWVQNASPASIGAHETAHAIEWLMVEKNQSYMYDWQRVEAWNKCTEAKGVVSQACKNIKKTEYGKGKRNFQLIADISRYAQENASETMAEAFADVFANGENASPLSVEIMRLTEEKVKAYEGS